MGYITEDIICNDQVNGIVFSKVNIFPIPSLVPWNPVSLTKVTGIIMPSRRIFFSFLLIYFCDYCM